MTDEEAKHLEPLLSAKTVAGYLGVSTYFVYACARLDPSDPEHLPSVRLGKRVLFTVHDVETYIREHHT